METTLYNIAGYRFDDWSQVKELYVPADAGSGTKTLKDRSRSALIDHLQYYFVPYDKLFIAFRALNIKLTTIGGIAIFGTSGRYGRYPEGFQSSGAPELWTTSRIPPLGANYYAHSPTTWGTLVVNRDNVVYECILTHAPEVDREPGYGVDWETYWHTHNEVWTVDWEDGKWYYFNEIALVDVGGVIGSYMCSADHTSDIENNKPCDNDWASFWSTGDEFIKNVSISRQNMNISKGTELPFGTEVIGVFSGNTTIGRWIGAKASTGTLKAGATILGIEVDA